MQCDLMRKEGSSCRSPRASEPYDVGLALHNCPMTHERRRRQGDGRHNYGSYTRFLARFGGVVLNSRALLVLGIWSLVVRHFLARQRYVEDSTFILSGRLLWAKSFTRE